MHWTLSDRCDPAVRPLADRHYSRQSIGAVGFVPPGRCLVLKAYDNEGRVGAYWVTSFPIAAYVRHAWAGAFVCSAFRNERPDLWLSSDLIREAVAATCWRWTPPPEGFVTFVDRDKTRPKRDPGYCYLKAGFTPAGHTQGGLVALTLTVDAMPSPSAPLGASMSLDGL